MVEIARFATVASIDTLLSWAADASAYAIRRRGDIEMRRDRAEAEDAERTRFLEWDLFDDGRRFGMHVELSAADGAAVMSAIDALARTLPDAPAGEEAEPIEARRADALVMLCTENGNDEAGERATVVVHARLDGLVEGTGARSRADRAVHPVVVERLLCDARVQMVFEDDQGDLLRLGATSRLAPPWMERQVRYRDGGCTFPGCGTRRHTHVHHVRWWRDRGGTSLENLALVCSYHHRLVHERGWVVERVDSGELAWRRPDGARWFAGPRPRAPVELERSA